MLKELAGIKCDCYSSEHSSTYVLSAAAASPSRNEDLSSLVKLFFAVLNKREKRRREIGVCRNQSGPRRWITVFFWSRLPKSYFRWTHFGAVIFWSRGYGLVVDLFWQLVRSD